MDILEGIDDVPWEELESAYLTADIPRLIRALVDDEATGPDGAERPLETLANALCHQGTLYSATVHAVPFLARVAAAGGQTAGILNLLAWCAANDRESVSQFRDPPAGAVRAAVADEADVIIPLLKHSDADVRATAAQALAECRVPDSALPALLDLWKTETSPEVRAVLLKGLSLLDMRTAADIALGAAAGTGDAAVRVVAAAVCAEAGTPWSDELDDAAVTWLREGGTELPYFWWMDRYAFPDLLTALAARGDLDLALDLAIAGLTEPVAPGVRQKAVRSADTLAKKYRIPIPRLAAALADVIGDRDRGGKSGPDAGISAILALRNLGAVPEVADAVFAVADVRGTDNRADHALAYLIEIGDPRALDLLARDRSVRPRAADAAGHRAPRPRPVPLTEDEPWIARIKTGPMRTSDELRNCRDLKKRLDAAISLWHHTRDLDTVLPVIAEILRPGAHHYGRFLVPHAADAAGMMGAAARPLVPDLLPLAGDARSGLSVIRALLRIEPADALSLPLTEMADRLVDVVGAPSYAASCFQTLATLREIGPAAVSTTARDRLARFADQDRRIVRRGNAQHIVRDDEEARAAIHEFLDGLPST
jgi:hypothetical protein